jgi:hypothetical protein
LRFVYVYRTHRLRRRTSQSCKKSWRSLRDVPLNIGDAIALRDARLCPALVRCLRLTCISLGSRFLTLLPSLESRLSVAAPESIVVAVRNARRPIRLIQGYLSTRPPLVLVSEASQEIRVRVGGVSQGESMRAFRIVRDVGYTQSNPASKYRN